MNFLHYDLALRENDVVEVELDKQANIRLLDATNFQNYKNGRRHHYYGGLAKKTPFKLVAPGSGDWHLVIDLGGQPGSIRASVRTMNHNDA